MKTSTLQSLIANIRDQLRDLHNEVEYQKYLLSNHPYPGESGSYCKDVIRKSTKKIAKLVVIQKALKREIAQQLKEQRAWRTLRARVGVSNMQE